MIKLLKEILEAIQNSAVTEYPYKYCPINFDTSNNAKIQNLYKQFPTIKSNSSEELGRSSCKLSTSEDISELWKKELDPYITEEIVQILFEKLDCGWRKFESKNPIYIRILRRLVKSTWLEFLYNSTSFGIQKKAINFFAQILSFIGFFDDFSVDKDLQVRINDLYWDWTFVEDRDLSKGLPPHTDSTIKVLTLLIPFSLNNEYRPGTSILKPKSRFRRISSWVSKRYPSFLFKEVYESPHRIGTALAFGKSEATWHGVKSIENKNEEHRRTLILNVYSHNG